MSALFNFSSFVVVILFTICTCTYIKGKAPRLLSERTGFKGLLWKFARVGERLSPWVSFACMCMAFSVVFL